jgi:hypothetical protein
MIIRWCKAKILLMFELYLNLFLKRYIYISLLENMIIFLIGHCRTFLQFTICWLLFQYVCILITILSINCRRARMYTVKYHIHHNVTIYLLDRSLVVSSGTLGPVHIKVHCCLHDAVQLIDGIVSPSVTVYVVVGGDILTMLDVC